MSEEVNGNTEEELTTKKQNSFVLKSIKPKTINQHKIFKHWNEGKNVFISGTAGTGKSFLSCFLGMSSVSVGEHDKLMIVRSCVPSRQQGFLPGDPQEKNEIYETPYEAVICDLYGRGDAYRRLRADAKVEFQSTSYLRGLTWSNAVIFIDEVQNMNMQEIHTVMTRIGDNCRVIIAGDSDQNDLMYSRHEESGFQELYHVISRMPSFGKVEMNVDDICRNEIVREWILARSNVPNIPWLKKND